MRAIPSKRLGARQRRAVCLLTCAVMLVAACGGDGGSNTAGDGRRPTVVVTTSVLGDVVAEILGTVADVRVVMPAGASPHEFQPSARDVATIRSADAIVANGGGLEEGLEDVIEGAAADGTPTFEAADAARVAAGDAALSPEDHEQQDGDDHVDAGDAPGDEHEHAAGAEAHFFTSPAAMLTVVEAMVGFFERELPSVDDSLLSRRADAYADTLRSLDEDVERLLAGIPPERRVLVTNHDVLSAFAVRYGFEVRGTVIPGSSTAGQADAATLAGLVATIQAAGVPAIFVDTSSSDRVARSLAGEAGGVEVVALYTEALGGADSDAPTYVEMIRVNARRVADALRP